MRGLLKIVVVLALVGIIAMAGVLIYVDSITKKAIEYGAVKRWESRHAR